MSDKESINKLENIVMIVIWAIVFCGGLLLIINLCLLTFNGLQSVLGLLFGLFYIGVSLYYLNKRILGGLK